MTRFVLATVAASTLASAASASFTGFTVERAITAAGNTQYKVYANFNAANLVFLNAFSWQNAVGSLALNARHQDAAEDANGVPLNSWSAGFNLLGSPARDNDSWVTASGSGLSASADTSFDPSFNPSYGSSIPNGAGWFDTTPSAPNAILAGGTQGGYRMLIMQICRTGDDFGYVSNHALQVAFKVNGTPVALFGNGGITVGIPAPGAVALLGLAGLTGRRRR